MTIATTNFENEAATVRNPISHPITNAEQLSEIDTVEIKLHNYE